MGNVLIRDDQNTLSTGDIAAIQSTGGGWPFEAHVLVGSFPTRDALEDAAHLAITSPRVVAIGVDPGHHHVAVRFGTSSGVKAGDYDSIAKAGNAHFRSGEWVAGIQAIGTRARASAQAHVAIAQSNEPVVVEEGLGTGAWLGIGLLFAVVVGCVVWLWRRSRKDRDSFTRALDDSREQTGQLAMRNIEEQSFMDRLNASAPATVTAPRAFRMNTTGANPGIPVSCAASVPHIPQSVTVNTSGNNDLLTGMLIGEVLGQPRETVIVEREVVRERPSYSSRSDDDSGGSDSSWSGGSSDSSSSSSDSSDSGGSSSSWDSGGDSGGGGDFGGGSDGGGGGGDF